MPVTVTDDKNRFVSNLEKQDFRVFDEGKEQKIRFFSRDQKQPVVVGFIVDMSNQTRLHWKTYQDAMQEMVLNLMPGRQEVQRLPAFGGQRSRTAGGYHAGFGKAGG